MNKLHLLILATFGIVTLYSNPLHADWVVIDGSRNFSHAMALHLIESGKPCTLVVKPGEDIEHVNNRFPDKKLLNIVEFDYSQEADLNTVQGQRSLIPLIKAIRGSKFMYLDPEHNNYTNWHSTVRQIALNSLFCAQVCKLDIFYAGRIYPFSGPKFSHDGDAKISDSKRISHTSNAAIVADQHKTQQGMTMNAIEKMLKSVAQNNKNQCKVHIVRTSYPFGKGVNDYLLSSSFKDIPHNGRLTWLFDIDKPYQFCYTSDAARLAHHLSEQQTDQRFRCVTFKGYEVPSVRHFGHAICEQANIVFNRNLNERIELNPRVVSKLQLRAVSIFKSNAKRGIDLAEFFSSPRLLKQSIDFAPTPIELALQNTLRWYATHQDSPDVETRGIFQP